MAGGLQNQQPHIPRRKQAARGWLEVICGSMFSGKTEELIRRLKRAQIAGQKVQVFKPLVDTRVSDIHVASHAGLIHSAMAVSESSQIEELVDADTDVVALDEAQFFDQGILHVCQKLANAGVRLIAAGLDLDFRAEPFGPMSLLAMDAELVDKLQAICVVCGAPASRTQRLINGRPAFYDDPLILIGAQESYEARCRHCYMLPIKRVSNHHREES